MHLSRGIKFFYTPCIYTYVRACASRRSARKRSSHASAANCLDCACVFLRVPKACVLLCSFGVSCVSLTGRPAVQFLKALEGLESSGRLTGADSTSWYLANFMVPSHYSGKIKKISTAKIGIGINKVIL